MMDDDGTEGLCFIWTIQNFLYCLQKTGGELESPSFLEDVAKTSSRWQLVLYPRGVNNSDYIAFYLKVISLDGVKKLNFSLSIRSAYGSFKKIKDSECTFNALNQKEGFQEFLDINEVYKKKDGAYLVNDSLTVRCRIWGNEIKQSCVHAQNNIGIEKITLRNLSLTNPTNSPDKIIQTKHVETFWFQTFIINVFWSPGYFAERKLQFEIRKNTSSRLTYITCDLTVFQNKRAVHSFKDEHWFDNSQQTQIWPLPFFIENDLLKAGNVSWNIDFVMSCGSKTSSILFLTNYPEDTLEEYSKPNIDLDCPGPLSTILHNVYTDGKFSDFTIRTPNKSFPVHKAILCNRSEVFSAMFEHDMKENRTAAVEIQDLDEDIVSKMLLFIYSNIVNDLDVETASKLYFAADKYKITDLKNKCSVFLVDNLNTSNVCEVLVLADMHRDEGLKFATQEFIMNKAAEIIISEEWKQLINDHSSLVADTLQLLCMRNLSLK